MAESKELTCTSPAVLHVLVVGFHHQKGSTVEYVYPPMPEPTSSSPEASLTHSLPAQWRHLPHIALPDGCHNYDTGHVTFTLADPTSAGHCVHGVSCFRQIDTRDLPSPTSDVTRSTVQKAVCLLCKWPVYAFLQNKLQVVTHAYFNSHDFEDTALLRLALQDLNQSLTRPLALQVCLEGGVAMAELFLPQKHRLLQVFKALLLQKRVLVFGSSPAVVSSCVTAIASLFPLIYETQIDDSCDERSFPIPVFPRPSSIQPYFSLQQMDSLTNKGNGPLLVGVVNPLYEKQHEKLADVFLRVDSGHLEVHGSDLHSSLILTAADLRFCHQLEQGMKGDEKKTLAPWVGSNEWVRAQFKSYLLSLLATSLTGDSLALDDFNPDFMRAWLQAGPYLRWVESSQKDNLDDIPARHICEGDLSLGDVGRQLMARASDLGLLRSRPKGKVVKESGRVISETSSKVGSWLSGVSSAVVSWWTGPGSSTDEEEKEENNKTQTGD